MVRARTVFRAFAAASACAGVATAARQTAERRAAERFYGVPLDRTLPTTEGTAYGGGPFVFHQVESFQTFHAASFDAVRAALPSSGLHPVRLPGGRAVVYVGALQYGDITANGVDGLAALPYGEVMISAPVTRRPAPPLLPLVAPAATGIAAGAFVLHLPVTTRVARDAGRLIWGLPKFVADLDFDDSIKERRVQLTEGGRTILTLRVRPAGRPTTTHDTFVLYSVLGGELIEATVPTYGIRQLRWGRAGGHLELGDHQVADELRQLQIAPEPFLTMVTTGERLAMTVGKPVGPASAYLGYIGEERDLGRYIVRYPNTRPIDRYAPFAPTAGPLAAMERVAPAAEMTAPVAV
jgi:hypothetical protein